MIKMSSYLLLPKLLKFRLKFNTRMCIKMPVFYLRTLDLDFISVMIKMNSKDLKTDSVNM